jgi:hypothetical protein
VSSESGAIHSDANAALAFIDKCGGKMIYKTLADPFLGLGNGNVPLKGAEPTVSGKVKQSDKFPCAPMRL